MRSLTKYVLLRILFFRNIVLNHGLFDQLRVNHGREFFYMLGIQEHLSHLRRNKNIQCYQPFLQPTVFTAFPGIRIDQMQDKN